MNLGHEKTNRLERAKKLDYRDDWHFSDDPIRVHNSRSSPRVDLKRVGQWPLQKIIEDRHFEIACSLAGPALNKLKRSGQIPAETVFEQISALESAAIGVRSYGNTLSNVTKQFVMEQMPDNSSDHKEGRFGLVERALNSAKAVAGQHLDIKKFEKKNRLPGEISKSLAVLPDKMHRAIDVIRAYFDYRGILDKFIEQQAVKRANDKHRRRIKNS